MKITAYVEWGVKMSPDFELKPDRMSGFVEFFRVIKSLPSGDVLEKKSIIVHADGQVWRSIKRVINVKPAQRSVLDSKHVRRIFEIATILRDIPVLPSKALAALDTFVVRGVYNQYIDIYHESLMKEVKHEPAKSE